jgi:hypothetical protein
MLRIQTMDDGLSIVIPDDVAQAHDMQLGDEVELVRTAEWEAGAGSAQRRTPSRRTWLNTYPVTLTFDPARGRLNKALHDPLVIEAPSPSATRSPNPCFPAPSSARADIWSMPPPLVGRIAAAVAPPGPARPS